jgi:hypothetical protein
MRVVYALYWLALLLMMAVIMLTVGMPDNEYLD